MKNTFAIAASACLFLTAACMQAGITANYTGTVYNQTGGYLSASTSPGGTPIGTFTNSTSLINYNVPVPGGTTLQNFVEGGGGVPDTTLALNSYYSKDMSVPDGKKTTGYSTEIVLTGNATFNAGDIISITHDDGVILQLNGTSVIDSAKPTSKKTDTFTVGAGGFASGAFSLFYEATAGNPENLILKVTPAAVPEPTSIILLGTTFLGLGTLVRRKLRKA